MERERETGRGRVSGRETVWLSQDVSCTCNPPLSSLSGAGRGVDGESAQISALQRGLDQSEKSSSRRIARPLYVLCYRPGAAHMISLSPPPPPHLSLSLARRSLTLTLTLSLTSLSLLSKGNAPCVLGPAGRKLSLSTNKTN